jgi:hypothetical protein
MLKIPVIEQNPRILKVLRHNCSIDDINSPQCFDLTQKSSSEYKFEFINKTIYEKKFDCCPGWSHIDDIPGCTKSNNRNVY